jgi:hypothetical protein
MAVANSGRNSITILLSNGNGTFTPAGESSPTGNGQELVTIGDFDGDGIVDLSVLDHGSSYVAILRGKGDGTFMAGTSIATEPVPYSPPLCCMVTGDVNGDGLTDIVVSNTVLFAQSGWSATATATDVVPMTPGTHLVESSYQGDGSYLGSISDSTSLSLQKAALTSPTPGSRLSGSDVTFSWTYGSGVIQYKLYLANNGVGGSNLYSTGDTTVTHATVTGLPTSGVTIYARLWSLTTDGWQYSDYTYAAFASPIPELLSPEPGSHLTGSSLTFQWSAGSGVSEYGLTVGTNWVGGGNLYAATTTATQVTVSGLPTSGLKLYARLWSKVQKVWQYTDYTYTALGDIAPGEIISPAPGSHLTGSSLTFQWSPGSGVTEYGLAVGTNWVGGGNLYAGNTTATQVTVSGLPTTGVTIYARLRSKIQNVWQYKDYTYTAFGDIAAAELISPVPGSQLTGSSLTFQWSPGNGVTEYGLTVGTNWIGGGNLYAATTTATQVLVPGLPTGGVTIYARLWSKIQNVWRYTDYMYTGI